MTINQIQDEIIADFSLLDDWMDRYEMIIEMGNELDPMPEGCQSRVWISGELDADNRLQLQADSDAVIVKGIIAMLLKVLSGQTPADILHADLYFIDKIGLKEHLSPTRSNGLLSMVRHIKLLASTLQ